MFYNIFKMINDKIKGGGKGRGKGKGRGRGEGDQKPVTIK